MRAALFDGGTPTPQTIGRFRITGELGRGGMGEVLAAFDDELERKVAIKLLHRDIGAQHGSRLQREAKSLAKLSHPNVVHVYEVGEHDDRLSIAMELVPGSTLRAWLAEEGRSANEILDMFVAAGRGLAAAHEGGMVHRDFKPDNVLVGEDGRPRILDFGLARADDREGGPRLDAPDLDALGDQISGTEDTQLEGSLTATGAILGTPAYMSPEQIAGQRTTAATDQFSFCVALWEAMYGRRPFAGKGLRELAQAVLHEPPDAPEQVRGPAGLRRILERGLAKSAQSRWPSVEALLAQIEELRAAPQRRQRAAVLGGAVALAGVASIQRARLLHAMGRDEEAIDALERVLATKRSPPIPGTAQYGAVFEATARHHLEAIRGD